MLLMECWGCTSCTRRPTVWTSHQGLNPQPPGWVSNALAAADPASNVITLWVLDPFHAVYRTCLPPLPRVFHDGKTVWFQVFTGSRIRKAARSCLECFTSPG